MKNFLLISFSVLFLLNFNIVNSTFGKNKHNGIKLVLRTINSDTSVGEIYTETHLKNYTSGFFTLELGKGESEQIFNESNISLGITYLVVEINCKKKGIEYNEKLGEFIIQELPCEIDVITDNITDTDYSSKFNTVDIKYNQKIDIPEQLRKHIVYYNLDENTAQKNTKLENTSSLMSEFDLYNNYTISNNIGMFDSSLFEDKKAESQHLRNLVERNKVSLNYGFRPLIYSSSPSVRKVLIETDNDNKIYATGKIAGKTVIYCIDKYTNLSWLKILDGRLKVIASAANIQSFCLLAKYRRKIVIDNKNYTKLDKDNYIIIHLDSNGNIVWTKIFGGKSLCVTPKICLDNNNNLYIVGYYDDDFAIDNTLIVEHSIYKNIFIAQINDVGKTSWVKTFGGDLDDICKDFCLDNENNLLLTGYTINKPIIHERDSAYKFLFLRKYNSEAELLNDKLIPVNKNVTVNAITCNSKNQIIIGGMFTGELNLSDNFFLATSTKKDLFLLKTNANFETEWLQYAYGRKTEILKNIVCDSSDNIYLTGIFNSKLMRFSNCDIFSRGLYDIFLAKFDINGKCIWAKSAGGSNHDDVFDIAQINDVVLLTGEFVGTAKFGDILYDKLDKGALIWIYDPELSN